MKCSFVRLGRYRNRLSVWVYSQTLSNTERVRGGAQVKFPGKVCSRNRNRNRYAVRESVVETDDSEVFRVSSMGTSSITIMTFAQKELQHDDTDCIHYTCEREIRVH